MKKNKRKILIVILVLLVGLSFGARFSGLRPFVVATNSMSQTYPSGTLIYTKDVAFESLQVGDVITYVASGDRTVTHRIVSINTQTKTVMTKGDSNEFADAAPVYAENIVGKVIFGIPKLGVASDVIKNIIKKVPKGETILNEL